MTNYLNNQQIDKKISLKSKLIKFFVYLIFYTLAIYFYFYLMINVFKNNYYPHSMTIDQQGNIYITDGNIPGLRKFSQQGNILLTIGSRGTADGQFEYVDDSQLTVDSNGYIYMLESYKNQVQKFDKQGNFVAKWEVSKNSYQILAGNTNELYLSSPVEPAVRKADRNGKTDQTWSPRLGRQTRYIHQIAVSQSGELYIRIDNTISKLDKNGAALGSIILDNVGTGYWNVFRVDNQGNFFLGGDSVVYKFNSQGKFLGSWQLTSQMYSGFRDMALDSQGNVYTLRGDITPIIQKFDNNGKALGEWSYGLPAWVSLGGQLVYLAAIGWLSLLLRSWLAKPQDVVAGLPLPASVEQYKSAPHLLQDSLDLNDLSGNVKIQKQAFFILMPLSILSFLLICFIAAKLVGMASSGWAGWLRLDMLALVPLVGGIIVLGRKELQRTKARQAEFITFLRQVMGTLPEANRSLFINTEATNANETNRTIIAATLYGMIIYCFLIFGVGNMRSDWQGRLIHLAIIISPFILLLGLLWLSNFWQSARQRRPKLSSAEFGHLARLSGIWLARFVLLIIGCEILNFFLTSETNRYNPIVTLTFMLSLGGYCYLATGIIIVPHKWFCDALNKGNYEQALHRASYLRSIYNSDLTREWQISALRHAGRFSEAEYLIQEALAKITAPLGQKVQLALVLSQLSLLRIDQQRYAEALFLLERAIICNSVAVYNLNNLAEVYLRANANPQRALELLNKAGKNKLLFFLIKALNPHYNLENYWINQAWALECLGQSERADAAIAQAFQKADKKYQPGLVALHRRTAQIMLLRGETSQATEHLAQAELLDPQDNQQLKTGNYC